MPPNVLLIVLDSVRYSNTSFSGYDRDTTPHLIQFAEGATVYHQARAPSVASLPSHVSIFSGQPVASHCLYNDAHHRGEQLDPAKTIWKELAHNGYDTACFSSNPYLTELGVGIKDCFQRVETLREKDLPYPSAADPWDAFTEDGERDYLGFAVNSLKSGRPIRSVINGVSAVRSAKDSPRAGGYFDALLDWTHQQKGDWAACVNLMDTHTPYQPDPDQRNWSNRNDLQAQEKIDHPRKDFRGGGKPWELLEEMVDLYDDSIWAVDKAIGSLIDSMEDRGLLDDTMVIITGDHGEAFGEEDPLDSERLASHSVGTHEALLHVPLIVKHPGQSDGQQVDQLASLTQFPQVTKAIIDGGKEDFTVEWTISSGRTTADEINNGSGRQGYTHILYDQLPGGVAKYAASEADSYAEVIAGNGNISPTPRKVIEERIPTLSDISMKSSNEQVSDEVQQRLETLGYH